MSIKFLSNNLVDTATITGSTENAQFPASNIAEEFRTKVYRSTSNTDNVVFDLGSIEPVDYFSFVPNWQDGFGFATITLQGNATDVWTSPTYDSGSITFDTTHEVGIKSFTEENLRYWRVVLTSTLGYCELSNVFIGKAVDISTNGINYGYQLRHKDIVRKRTTRYGQEVQDIITTQKEISSLIFKVMNVTEIDQFFEVSDNRGTTKPFFIDFCTDLANPLNDNERLSGNFKFMGEPSFKNTNSGFWEVSFGLREQK